MGDDHQVHQAIFFVNHGLMYSSQPSGSTMKNKSKNKKTKLSHAKNLMDLDSMKGLFPHANRDPRVLHKKRRRKSKGQHHQRSPQMLEEIDTVLSNAKVDHSKRSRNNNEDETTDSLVLKRRQEMDKRRMEEEAKRKHQDKLQEQMEREEKERIARQLGMTVEQMDALDQAERDADDAAKLYLEAFQKFDEDGSGDISPDELRKVLESLGESPEDMEEIIAEADTDGDGSINYEEFVNLMKARKRLLAMAQTLHKSSSTNDEAYRDRDSEDVGSKNRPEINSMHKYMVALPPLKIPTNGNDKRGRNSHQQQGKKLARKTPHVLRVGSQSNQDELRRELALANSIVKKLDANVNEIVQWVQENCNVTSLRAQLFCKRWGMQKLTDLFKRIEYKEVMAAWKVWNKFVLWKRNQSHVEQYMKLKGSRRLTSLFANWKRKKTIAALNSWVQIVHHQQNLERHAAVIQIQRVARGFLGRNWAVQCARTQAIIMIQKVFRGHLGRKKVQDVREHLRRTAAASYIQRLYRGYAGKKLSKMMLQAQREMLAATRIQKVWRGHMARKQTAHLFEEKRRHVAATKVQKVFRGFVARQITWAHQQAIAENTAATWIQTFVRGYFGRIHGLQLMETRMQLIAEEEAALKIQTAYRRYLASIRVHKIRMNKAATTIQTKWRAQKEFRGYRMFKLERSNRMKRERQGAIKIQCMVRSHFARKVVQEKRQHRLAALRIQAARRGQIGRRKYKSKRETYELQVREKLRLERENVAATKIQTMWRGHKGVLAAQLKKQAVRQTELEAKEAEAEAKRKAEALELKKKLAEDEAKQKRLESAQKAEAELKRVQTSASIQINKFARGHLARKQVSYVRKLKSFYREENAAIVIQKHIRAKLARKVMLRKHQAKAQQALAALEKKEQEVQRQKEEQIAAIKMQSAWRTKMASDFVAEKRKLVEEEKRQKEMEAAAMIQTQLRMAQAENGQIRRQTQLAQSLEKATDDSAKQKAQQEFARQQAAQVIQRVFRAHRDYLRVQRMREERARIEAERKRVEENLAATKIQTMFRIRRDKKRAQAIRDQLKWEAEHKQEARRRRELEEQRKKHEMERQRLEEEMAAIKLQNMVRTKHAKEELFRRKQHAEEERLRIKAIADKRREEVAKENAAIQIQCAFRTSRAKKEMFIKMQQHQAKLAELREQGEKEEALRQIQEKQEMELAATRMQNMYRSRVARTKVNRKRKEHNMKMEQERERFEKEQQQLAACKIQATFRGWRDRGVVQLKKQEILAAQRKATSGGTPPAGKPGTPGGKPGTPNTGKPGTPSKAPPSSGQDHQQALGFQEWVEYWDEHSQAYYYFNTVTQEARWTDPRYDGGAPGYNNNGYDTTGSATDYDTDNHDANYDYYNQQQYYYGGYYDEYGNWVEDPYAASAQAGGYADPNLWEEYYDDSYQASYYYNVQTGETSWHPPQGFVSQYANPWDAPRYG